MAEISEKCIKYIVFEVSDASESFLCLNRLYYLFEGVRVFSRIKISQKVLIMLNRAWDGKISVRSTGGEILKNFRYWYGWALRSMEIQISIEVENRHMHFGALFSHIEAK